MPDIISPGAPILKWPHWGHDSLSLPENSNDKSSTLRRGRSRTSLCSTAPVHPCTMSEFEHRSEAKMACFRYCLPTLIVFLGYRAIFPNQPLRQRIGGNTMGDQTQEYRTYNDQGQVFTTGDFRVDDDNRKHDTGESTRPKPAKKQSAVNTFPGTSQ